MTDTTEKPAEDSAQNAENDAYAKYHSAGYTLTEDDKKAIDERDAMLEKEKNPYALRRNIMTVITVASLVVYLALPTEMATVRAVILVAFFVLIMVLTYFQQQFRSFKIAKRNPEAYDSQHRYHKEWENGRPQEPVEHKNAPNRNQKNKGKKKKQFNK